MLLIFFRPLPGAPSPRGRGFRGAGRRAAMIRALIASESDRSLSVLRAREMGKRFGDRLLFLEAKRAGEEAYQKRIVEGAIYSVVLTEL